MIYFIEFVPPFHHAKYYTGWCEDHRLSQRFQEHATGYGARICRAAVLQGHTLRVVVTMPGSRADERRIKRMKCTPRIVARLMKGGAL